MQLMILLLDGILLMFSNSERWSNIMYCDLKHLAIAFVLYTVPSPAQFPCRVFIWPGRGRAK